jgi:predicted phosphodiesterase
VDKYILKLIQISDLHIVQHRNLLEPMIDQINRETVDLVIVTGDTVHNSELELFKIAVDGLNRIKHRVVVLPGDYDGGALWREHFGDRYKSVNLNGYCLEFLDTSFMRHRYSVGWGEVLKEDPEQYEWLKKRLEIDKYHIIFSHHPVLIRSQEESNEFLLNNVRACFSGHLRNPLKFYFKYDKPKGHFPNGFCCVPLKFHGNSCYLVVLIKDNDEIVNVPRLVHAKRTAW